MRTLLTNNGATHDPSTAAIAEHLARCHEEGFWLDITAPGADDIQLLAETFGFHPLTLEDVQHRNQRPKIETFPGYEFMVVFSAVFQGDELERHEFHLYIGKDYLVSIHDLPEPQIDELCKRIATAPEITRGRPGFLTYLVVDAVVDSTFEALVHLDSTIDELEAGIIERADPRQLRRIYGLKHSVTELRQILSAQRDLFQRLISDTLDDPELTVYYRDVYDHIIRQYETVDSLRDLLTGAMDVYLSTVSNRLNTTMKQLTVVASLFLPLSFLTGFYGMNFNYLTTVLEVPHWTFWVGIATMLGATGFQLYFFKRRGWI